MSRARHLIVGLAASLSIAFLAAGAVRGQEPVAPAGGEVNGSAREVAPSPAAAVAADAPSTTVPGASPAPPRHPAAAKAFIVLETYCARCHQAGQQGASATAPASSAAVRSGLANILALEEIARVPALVRPGQPDASPLYHRMFVHPHAIGADEKTPEPSAIEVEAVRDWIEDIGARDAARRAACRARPVIGHAEIAVAMQRWLEQIGPEAARETRFLSLAHLANDCATDGEISAWRQAATTVVNSLSWTQAPATLEAVGDTLTLYAVRLSALGWLPAHWERLIGAYPRGPLEPPPERVMRAAGTAVPVLRADWLASAALRPPLYYDLLGLPTVLSELERLVGLTANMPDATTRTPGRAPAADAVVEPQSPMRVGIRTSTVTRGPRLLERKWGRGRPLWIAYDLGLRPDGRDPFDLPLAVGPGAPLADGDAHASREQRRAGEGRAQLAAAAVRVMLALPNGLPAFAIFGEDGKRQPASGARAGTASDRLHDELIPDAGLGCLACHRAGVLPAADEVRAHVDSDRFGGDAAAREMARLLFPAAAEASRIMDKDRSDVMSALAAMSVDPELSVHGLAPMHALAQEHDRDVGLDRAAAEFGLPLAVFIERLKSYDGPDVTQSLASRLRQGTLPRADAERLYHALRSNPTASAALSPAAVKTANTGTLTLALWTESPSYRLGELVGINVLPGADCHLTLISVDPKGKATVLFPNDFDQDNLIRGGRVHRVPARDGPYQLRLRDKGTETIVASCDTWMKSPDGIAHDFERQRFTVLGNWRNFLRNSVEDSGEATRREPERPPRSGARRLVRGKQAELKSEKRSDARPEADQRPDAFARTAIRIDVQ